MRNPDTRVDYILQELVRVGRVSVEELSERFHVDTSTIRRDLMQLERQNLLKRVHGGAVAVDVLRYTAYAYDLTFQENLTKQVEEKTRIALDALAMIRPGDTIALSPGTTTTQLARIIRQVQPENLTVVTNAVNIAMELAGLRTVTVLMTGGMILPDFFALVGPLADQSLEELYVDKAFIGVHGISIEQGLTGPNQLEALTFRVMLTRARQGIVLADHTKFGRVALHRIAPLSAIQTVITDRMAEPEIVAGLEAAGLDVHRA